MEQWIYLLNTGEIPDDATAPGLQEARDRLKLDRLGKTELEAYYRHLDNVVILRDNIYTECEEGREEGRAEGREEGRTEERVKVAEQALKMGMSVEDIVKLTGLSREEIDKFEI